VTSKLRKEKRVLPTVQYAADRKKRERTGNEILDLEMGGQG
jgi:hypothetical protein